MICQIWRQVIREDEGGKRVVVGGDVCPRIFDFFYDQE